MSGPSRLPAPHGRLIDRGKPVRFTFEGRAYEGFAGDTLASALLANGRWVMSRSFKYHRPRGPWSLRGLDANTYVQVGEQPNLAACTLPLTENVSARAQNVLGSLDRDLLAGLGWLKPFFPAGFYYRSFFRPKGAWQFWEPLIARLAGLGRVARATPHPAGQDKAYAHAQVAVIGGGLAGMEATLAAAEAGASVLLIDDGMRLGGDLLAGDAAVASRVEALAEAVAHNPAVQVIAPAQCVGWYADHWLAVMQAKRLWKIRAEAVVLATGALEQPPVCRNNDVPGIVPAEAVRKMIRLWGVRPGDQAVVLAPDPEAEAIRALLDEAGTTAVAVRAPDAGQTLVEVIPAPGKRGVRAAVFQAVDDQGEPHGPAESIPCDVIVTAGTVQPLGQLACHAGAQLAYDPARHGFVLQGLAPRAFAAGAVAWHLDPHAAAASGKHAGQAAAQALGLAADPGPAPAAAGMNAPWRVVRHPKGMDFIDVDEDQTSADLATAVAEGFTHLEHIKRYTTTGMGPSQGRTSALASARLARHLTEQALDGTLVTTQRPPFAPVPIRTLAGRGFAPERRTPMDTWHRAAGASMMPAGAWWRPAYYGAEREAAIAAEARQIRQDVGLIDVSTLGGIDLSGPDAATFLNRLYTFAYLKQPVGKVRYALLCEETGAIVDDGVAARLAEDRFYVTTTTTGAEAVYRIMLLCNAQWRMAVDFTPVTTAWAGITVAGPKARTLLERLPCDVALDAQSFPYLGVREGTLAGAPVRIMRTGFVGELSFELHVPYTYAASLWSLLMEMGQDLGVRPVGIEAQRVLRLEKGHIIIGQDTDGLTTPAEAAMAWAVSGKKPAFQGKRALEILDRAPPTRRLTGFRLPESAVAVPEGCLCLDGSTITGRVTSCAASPALGHVIGLAMLAPAQAAPGQTFIIKDEAGRLLTAETVALPFIDPDNQRQAL